MQAEKKGGGKLIKILPIIKKDLAKKKSTEILKHKTEQETGT